MFYSACPNMCPLIVDSGKAVEHALSPAERAQLQLLYISLDPQRDTPPTLSALARKRGLDPARWSLASPRAQDVRSVAGVLDVRYRKLANGEFNHTSALLLLDRDGRIVARTERIGGAPDPDFLASVHRVLRGMQPDRRCDAVGCPRLARRVAAALEARTPDAGASGCAEMGPPGLEPGTKGL